MTAQSANQPTAVTDEQLAEHYERTHDLSDFDFGAAEPLTPARQRLDVSITVRFTPSEIDALRAAADLRGMKVTALIRSLAVQHHSGSHPVDVVGARQVLFTLVRELSDKLGGDVTITPNPGASERTKQPADRTR